MDIGIWMSKAVLAHKLEARGQRKSEQAWNLKNWPSRLSEEGEHRLFVASEGAWRGYFILAKEALLNPDDPKAPFTLLFDANSWTPISTVPVKHFRGFTYKIPDLSTRDC